MCCKDSIADPNFEWPSRVPRLVELASSRREQEDPIEISCKDDLFIAEAVFTD